jgi:hypothetical protein
MPKEITFYVFLGEKRDPSEIYANSNLRNLTHITQKPSYVYTFFTYTLKEMTALVLYWCLDYKNYECKRLGFLLFLLCEILFSSSPSDSDILWEMWGWELRERLSEWFWHFVRNVRPGETDRPTACIHARAISPAILPLENEVIVARYRKNNNYHSWAFCYVKWVDFDYSSPWSMIYPNNI